MTRYSPPPPPIAPDRLLLLLGLPRSGTSWLAATFDSHPDVLYRHEPDILDRALEIYESRQVEDITRAHVAARAHVLRLAALSCVRTAGPGLTLRKSYRSAATGFIRAAGANAGRVLGRVRPAAQFMTLPDGVRPGRRPLIVIKSVIRTGSAGLWAAAVPEARIIYIVRSPFGQVASMLAGERLGKLVPGLAVEGLWTWPEAQAHGLTRVRLLAMPPAAQLAWHWRLHAERALAELELRENVRIVGYEQLCAAPLAVATGLFGFAGLAPGAQTQDFLARSTRGGRGYFSVSTVFLP